MSPTVLLADDHLPTRTGVRAALEGAGLVVVADVGSGDAAIKAALEHKPDIALLDVRMPGDGIVAAAEIASRLPETVVVMLSATAEDEHLFEALRVGARGYLLKDTDPDRLPMALEGVLSGEAALPRTLVSRLIEEFRTRDRRRRIPMLRPGGQQLTEREWEVLELMRDGLRTKDIAARLTISEVTVRRHVSATLRKLQVKDRSEALDLLEKAGR
jgi:DNA-binding NarL/FixJ family response regulator